MTKKEIVKKIAEQSGISQQVALEAVQLVFDGGIMSEVLLGATRLLTKAGGR